MTISITKSELLEWKLAKMTASEASRKKPCSIGVIRRAEKIHDVFLYRNDKYARAKVDDVLLGKVKACISLNMTMNQICKHTGERYNKIKNICYQNGLKARPALKSEFESSEQVKIFDSYGSESILYCIPKDIKKLVCGNWKGNKNSFINAVQ